jgi:hypothetical protein
MKNIRRISRVGVTSPMTQMDLELIEDYLQQGGKLKDIMNLCYYLPEENDVTSKFDLLNSREF